FALPVLERLKPKSRRLKIFCNANRGVARSDSLLTVKSRATNGVRDDRHQEEQGECEAERILVKLEHPTSASNRPRHALLGSFLPGVIILRRFFVGIFGFRRTLLVEEHGQKNGGCHLQER